ncbi:hypothetical protein ES332_D07G223100v1 [Gossypium tomentosum]|uniref:Cysteine-rich transmembrane domain-containing protein n=1 Tax=Gossypium tomentosum TaxID=34277 RepID=A0A5D2K9P7_GOSTO|nr:hypothetical protein ES332_D07G223100v1 [Gossypium tomentosum]
MSDWVWCGAFSLLFVSRYSIVTIFNLTTTAVFTLTAVASQPPSTEAGPYVAPPPAGYPMSKGDDQPYYAQNPVAVETKSRGDGFWKGCAAALCCCCVLDACC